MDVKGRTGSGGNPPRLHQKAWTDEVKTHQFEIKKKSLLLSWLFNIFSNKKHFNQFKFGYSWNSLFWNIKRQRVSTGFALLLLLFCYYFWHSSYIWYVKLLVSVFQNSWFPTIFRLMIKIINATHFALSWSKQLPSISIYLNEGLKSRIN